MSQFVIALHAFAVVAVIIGIVLFYRVSVVLRETRDLVATAKDYLSMAAKHGQITDRARYDIKQIAETEVATAKAVAEKAEATIAGVDKKLEIIREAVVGTPGSVELHSPYHLRRAAVPG